MPQAYCVKDRKKVEMKDPQEVTLANGRPALKGTCPECGSKVTLIGGGKAKGGDGGSSGGGGGGGK